MDDPIFSYEIIVDLVEAGITFDSVFFFNNPPISLRRLGVLFFVYGPFFFVKFVSLFIYWNIIRGGRVKVYLTSQNIQCYEFSEEQMGEARLIVQKNSPDLLVSVFCNLKISDELLSLARCGGVNLHQGKLPDYRGLMPIFYCQMNGEETIGSSIHLMNQKFDAGRIISEGCLNIKPGDNYVKLWKSINKIGAKNMALLLKNFEYEGSLPEGIEQPYTGAYYSLPSVSMALKYWIKRCQYILLPKLTNEN